MIWANGISFSFPFASPDRGRPLAYPHEMAIAPHTHTTAAASQWI
jgi:hypothetical protein